MSGVGISGQVSYIYNQASGLGWLCCFVPPLWLKPLFDCPEIRLCNSNRRKFSALIILPVAINLAQSINTCYIMVLRKVPQTALRITRARGKVRWCDRTANRIL